MPEARKRERRCFLVSIIRLRSKRKHGCRLGLRMNMKVKKFGVEKTLKEQN